MAVKLSPFGPKPAFWDSSGNPLSGGKLYFYAAGSTTAQNTYTDSTGGSANANPVVLNSRGEPANEIWFTTGLTYKAVLKTSADVTIWTVDNLSAINDVSSLTADEWLSPGVTPTFASATSFTLSGDQTSEFHIGRRLKSTNSGGTIYSTITNSAFGALTTVTVLNDSGTLDSGLSAVSYGILRATNPSVARLNGALTVTGALGNSFIGDTSNANQTLGLTINQGASDDEILSLKSSDVAHGITSQTETDTYASFHKSSATDGGLVVRTWGGLQGLLMMQTVTSETTTKATTANAACQVIASLKSGTGAVAMSADTNLFAVTNASNTRFILDADGDSHQDVGTAWTNFDAFDDVALLDALSVAVSKPGDPIKQQFGEFLQYNRKALEKAKLVTFNEDGHHFVNMSKLTMALTGAVRQVGHALQSATNRLAAMEERMLAIEAKPQ
jgi:hypothetical protein